MYLKRFCKQRAGMPTNYLSLAHNIWEVRADGEKQTRPFILMSLGPEDESDPGEIEKLLVMAQALFDLCIKRGMTPAEAVEDVAKSLRPPSSPVRSLSSKTIGMRLLLEPIWEELGIREALREYQRHHRIRFDFERIVFGMVLNRLVDPLSKFACNEWLKEDAFFPEGEEWEVQHFYRALDLLHEHWEELEAALYQALWERSSEEDRMLWLTDTTSLYFEANANDKEIAALRDDWALADEGKSPEPKRARPQVVNEPALRMQGHNKDGHPGDPQVVVASVCLKNGLVLRHKTYPGNTADVTIAEDLLSALPAPEGAARLWVTDGGMASADLLATLDQKGWFRLTAESLRKSAFAKAHILPVTGRYDSHPEKSRYSFKTVLVPGEESPSARDELWVLSRNDADRERQLRKIDGHLEKVKEMLSTRQPSQSHSRSVCKVVTHPSLKRYVMPSEKVPGRFVLDQEAIRRERQLAGMHLLRSTMTDFEGHELFDAYQMLQVVERNHREYKGPLQLRPCYHRSSQRIRAHVMLTILATNCLRVLEQKTGQSIADLRKRFDRIYATEMEEGRKTFWMPTGLGEEERQILKQVGAIEVPDRWQSWRENRPIVKR